MNINPEFARNLWLEMNLHRLVSVPLVFGLMLFLGVALNDYQLDKEIAYIAVFWFVLFTGIWGTKRATGAVYDEVVGRTWDWQRMSGLDPWAMTWGKLFGSTLFAWYGGLICLLVAVVGLLNDQSRPSDWQWLALALGAVLCSHALGLLLSLIYIRSRPLEHNRVGGSLYLLVLLLIITLMGNLAESADQQLLWYGLPVDLLHFALISTLVFWLWAITGAYRVMRRELSHAARPWVWLLFLLFCALYLGGFADDNPSDWLLTALLCWQVATLMALFVEPKDPVPLRGLLAALRQGDGSGALLLVPAWLSGLLLASLAVLGLQFVPALPYGLDLDLEMNSSLLGLLLLLFLLRDTSIFLLLGFSGEARRAEATALVYLIILYGLIPALLRVLGWEQPTALFQPRPDLPLPIAFGGAATGALLAMALAYRQWRRLARRLGPSASNQ